MLECARAEQRGSLNSELLHQLLTQLLCGPLLPQSRLDGLSSALSPFPDLRYCAYCAVRRACEAGGGGEGEGGATDGGSADAADAALLRNCYHLLLGVPFSLPGAGGAPTGRTKGVIDEPIPVRLAVPRRR